MRQKELSKEANRLLSKAKRIGLKTFWGQYYKRQALRIDRK